MNCCLLYRRMIMIKLFLNEQISVIGYMTEPEEGTHILTRGGNKHKLVAQGWNHMKQS